MTTPSRDPYWELQDRKARHARFAGHVLRGILLLIAAGLLVAAVAAFARGGL